jgi:hypothetical protein
MTQCAAWWISYVGIAVPYTMLYNCVIVHCASYQIVFSSHLRQSGKRNIEYEYQILNIEVKKRMEKEYTVIKNSSIDFTVGFSKF